jgi:hypothetical protein
VRNKLKDVDTETRESGNVLVFMSRRSQFSKQFSPSVFPWYGGKVEKEWRAQRKD